MVTVTATTHALITSRLVNLAGRAFLWLAHLTLFQAVIVLFWVFQWTPQTLAHWAYSAPGTLLSALGVSLLGLIGLWWRLVWKSYHLTVGRWIAGFVLRAPETR